MNESPGIAIFDLDYTLLEGDSEAMWCQFLFNRQVVDRHFVQRIEDYYRDYDAGKLDIHEYEAFLLQPISEYPLPQMLQLRKDYLGEISQAIRPRMIRRLNWFRSLGYHLLLITASNSFLAEPIAQQLGFSNVICTQVQRVDGRYTTKLAGLPVFQAGKVTHLDAWLTSHNLNLEKSWGFSDSHNDIPLLERVQNPVAVTPDPRLRDHALEKGWKIILG
jgi:HAD superfamily hydrolase (TIGR01490 family)